MHRPHTVSPHAHCGLGQRVAKCTTAPRIVDNVTSDVLNALDIKERKMMEAGTASAGCQLWLPVLAGGLNWWWEWGWGQWLALPTVGILGPNLGENVGPVTLS